jgi:hypothetical protein
MTPIRLLLPLALLVPLCAGQNPASQPLLDGCSEDDSRLGVISAGDTVKVNQARAGGDTTCYSVTLQRDGQTLIGYVLGDTLPAVIEFLNQQARYRDQSFEAQEQAERARQAALAKAPGPGPDARPAIKLNPDIPAVFEEFSGRDVMGKPVSLSRLGGRLTLITFWSPRSPTSKGRLSETLSIYYHYKSSGLRAVGISLDPNQTHILEALDDMPLSCPQMPDRTGMAKRYGANPTTGTTYVLDASHHIVASGLTSSDLEKKVRELLASH